MLYSHTTKLVRFYDGVDGLKTGYTKEAGYCLTATAKRNKTRFIAVVMGASDSKVRNAEISEMFNYAFANYESEQLLSKNSVLGTVEVEKGQKKYVEIVPMEGVSLLNKKGDAIKNATYELDLKDVKAPLKKGDMIGKLIVKEDNKEFKVIDITVKEDVKGANIFMLYFSYLKDIFVGDIKLVKK